MSDTSDQRSAFGPMATAVGPWTAYSLSSCAVALSAYALGAQWVATPWLGLPVGVWGIASGYAVLACTRGTPVSLPAIQLPRFPTATAATAGLLERVRRIGAGRTTTPARDRRSAERAGPAVIRVGLDLPADERELILNTVARFEPQDAVRFEWVIVGGDDADHDARPRRRASDRTRFCDATLRRSSGPRGQSSLEISTPTNTSNPGWKDWGTPEDFSYAGVFPARLDPARVCFGNARVDADAAPALASLLCAAAAQRRTALLGGTGGVGLNAPPTERAADRFILDALRWAAVPGNTGAIRRVAARVGAAWLTTRGLAVAPAERIRLIDATTGVLTREPHVILQSLAAGVAAVAAGVGEGPGADPAGVEAAMADAVQRLLDAGERATVDPLPFVMSELEHGTGDALTLGRLAAGVAMLWSGARASSTRFLREDLLADIEHTGWLRQRAPMRSLLARLVRAADRARTEWDRGHSSRRAA